MPAAPVVDVHGLVKRFGRVRALDGLDLEVRAGVVAGLTLLLHAVTSRGSVLGWAAVGACLLVDDTGDLLRLPDAVRWLSPYAHAPAMPSEGFRAVPVVVSTAVAAALVVAAWWRYRGRDIG